MVNQVTLYQSLGDKIPSITHHAMHRAGKGVGNPAIALMRSRDSIREKAYALSIALKVGLAVIQVTCGLPAIAIGYEVRTVGRCCLSR
jgi:hypothetical protein